MKIDWKRLADENSFPPEITDAFIEAQLQEKIKAMLPAWLEINAILFYVARQESGAYLHENYERALHRDFLQMTNIKPRVVYTATHTTSCLWYRDKSHKSYKKQEYFKLNRDHSVYRNIFASNRVPLWAKVKGSETERTFKTIRTITERLSVIRSNLREISSQIAKLYEIKYPKAPHAEPLTAATLETVYQVRS